jgi:hypothetical protein
MTRFKNKFIDTFTVGGNEFRIIDTYANDTIISEYVRLQQKVNGKWCLQKNVFTPSVYGGEIYLEDLNQDGYKDLCQYIRFVSDVTFFNAETKKFEDSVNTFCNEISSKVIDLKKGVFAIFIILKAGLVKLEVIFLR